MPRELRVSELVRLKVSDIDSERMMVKVEQGKGKKDRYTILSERLLSELRAYWKEHRSPIWLFPNAKGRFDFDRLRPEDLQLGQTESANPQR